MQCPMTMNLFSNGDYFISQVLPYGTTRNHTEPIKYAQWRERARAHPDPGAARTISATTPLRPTLPQDRPNGREHRDEAS
ncbi:Uncharacterised protein [Mycobacteroides abscessus subsp. abscessus]|nr:Uncharacterised protein [Mycobacteroides abscessus subsp. abscessus]SHT21886.1 Uncharacterised protein [Mycobacteroides abscessus subsp. abscessus]SHU37480.1 Uncharacterised protein [Mycobacteroides abscessus subsp. abscessus]SHV04072.1 Uncharacterised protein [Mycobacteroides abscessus subsp. abscessus]SHX60579.1 Uncharacterised protein [Mycobacteroides abscessus subsp. abscessus]